MGVEVRVAIGVDVEELAGAVGVLVGVLGGVCVEGLVGVLVGVLVAGAVGRGVLVKVGVLVGRGVVVGGASEVITETKPSSAPALSGWTGWDVGKLGERA